MTRDSRPMFSEFDQQIQEIIFVKHMYVGDPQGFEHQKVLLISSLH